MSGWPAWAQDAREVADARVLAGFLRGLGEDGQTTSAAAPLVEELGLTGVDPDHLAVRLVELGYFREDSLTLTPGSDTLLIAEPLTIFLAHGRDNEFKWEVKNFIERIVDRTKVQVVILHEQANQGQTLLEKFEQYASTASYAVVLPTPDDVGGSVGDAQESRARQNVIFELGFFCGRLGRKHVAAIN